MDDMSRLVGKPTMWFPTRSDINRPVQFQKKSRRLKFRIYEEEKLYYPSSENKGADQLRSYCEADLRLCFRIGKIRFSHDAAHISFSIFTSSVILHHLRACSDLSPSNNCVIHVCRHL